LFVNEEVCGVRINERNNVDWELDDEEFKLLFGIGRRVCDWDNGGVLLNRLLWSYVSGSVLIVCWKD
jgi:hypothetical protein